MIGRRQCGVFLWRNTGFFQGFQVAQALPLPAYASVIKTTVTLISRRLTLQRVWHLELKNSSLAEKLYADFKDRYGNEPVPFPDVSETLKLLRRKYRIGLVSNGRTKGQTAKINACGISEFFSSICISESVGCKKPDAAIFQACLDELSVQPNEAVFVGDNPIVDIEPAKKLGMFTVWVKNPHFPAPVICDGIVTNICELPSVVAKLA